MYSYTWLAWFSIERCDCTLVILWLEINRLETNFETWRSYLERHSWLAFRVNNVFDMNPIFVYKSHPEWHFGRTNHTWSNPIGQLLGQMMSFPRCILLSLWGQQSGSPSLRMSLHKYLHKQIFISYKYVSLPISSHLPETSRSWSTSIQSHVILSVLTMGYVMVISMLPLYLAFLPSPGWLTLPNLAS